MDGVAAPHGDVVVETERLRLRRWRVSDAGVQHELWAERDDRVPPHRRLDPDGHPTVEELAKRIRASRPSSVQLLAIEAKDTDDVIGYCGLIDSRNVPAGEPELAYELLRRAWGRGYATEAALAVVDLARGSGFERLWATVRVWNIGSRRVLHKAGFVETGRVEPSIAYGDSLFTTRRL